MSEQKTEPAPALLSSGEQFALVYISRGPTLAKEKFPLDMIQKLESLGYIGQIKLSLLKNDMFTVTDAGLNYCMKYIPDFMESEP